MWVVLSNRKTRKHQQEQEQEQQQQQQQAQQRHRQQNTIKPMRNFLSRHIYNVDRRF